MAHEPIQAWLRAAEGEEHADRLAVLCLIAAQLVPVPVELDEARAALRRAELLLAAGGDPRRRLEPGGRAVTAVAADLDAPERRAALAAGLARLEEHVAGLHGVAEAQALLAGDPDLAWQAYAMSLLAAHLAGEDEDGW